MSNLARFAAYAAAFEQTFIDDDWTRLAPYFTDDAVYIVSGIGAGCELHGRDAIFAGMKKSLDGFDRRMATRQIVPTAPPRVVGDTITFAGLVRYQRGDSPPVELHATIVARFADDRIGHMHDTFAIDHKGATWLAAHTRDLDGSYI